MAYGIGDRSHPPHRTRQRRRARLTPQQAAALQAAREKKNKEEEKKRFNQSLQSVGQNTIQFYYRNYKGPTSYGEKPRNSKLEDKNKNVGEQAAVAFFNSQTDEGAIGSRRIQTPYFCLGDAQGSPACIKYNDLLKKEAEANAAAKEGSKIVQAKDPSMTSSLATFFGSFIGR